MAPDLREDLAAMAHTEDAVLSAAEARARAALICKIAALPPSAVVSKAALQSFRQQHLAMMSYSFSANSAKQNISRGHACGGGSSGAQQPSG